MTKTVDAYKTTLGNLRALVSGMSYVLNSTNELRTDDLNALRVETGRCLVEISTLDALATQQGLEIATARKHLSEVGSQIHRLMNALEPELIAKQAEKYDSRQYTDPHGGIKGYDTDVNHAEPDYRTDRIYTTEPGNG